MLSRYSIEQPNRHHVTTDGSLFGSLRQVQCVWMVRHNLIMTRRPMDGMYGMLDAEFEVQRAVKQVETHGVQLLT